MKINEKELDLLENEISSKISTYNESKDRNRDNYYFTHLNNKIFEKIDNKKNKSILFLNPKLGYALLFLISFAISFELINFSNKTITPNEDYLFSETTSWFEEKQFVTDVDVYEINLDYDSYITNELNYIENTSIIYEINDLPENELNLIYENIKSKKIL